MPSIAVRVPISLNRHFVTMTEVLARSLARNLQPGDWRLELTVSRDTPHTLDSELLAWTGDFPVTVEWVDAALFDRYSYIGTALQRHLRPTDMDLVAFMDADTLVVGPLAEAVHTVLAIDGIGGRTAWNPPDVDLAALIADVATAADLRRHVYAGYGVKFLTPKACPPYFNFGFVLASQAAVHRMSTGILLDAAAVFARATSIFNAQISLCRNALRLGIPTAALHDKFNTGTSQKPLAMLDDSPEVRDRMVAIEESLADPRVLHYCPRQPTGFDKTRDMASLEAAHRFAWGPEMQRGTLVLQRALRSLL
jgi:hypothetical protein